MGAVLVGKDGPSRGRLVPLGEAEVSLGRDEANVIALDDLSASRRHCLIRPAPGSRFQIVDLDSRNGTFVNGVPVHERLLEHNDEIRIGRCVFLFLGSSEPPDSNLDESLETGATTVILSRDSLYLDPEKLEKSLPARDRTARGVRILLRMSQALQSAPTLEELARQTLSLLADAIPAESGALLLTSPAAEIEAAQFWGHGNVRLSPEIRRKIVEQRVALLCENGALAAPLICFDRVEGVLILEPGRANFDQGHLDLAAAVGSIAGLAVHNLRRIEDLEREKQRLESEIEIQHDMVGESQAMREVHRFIARVAPADSTVLIGGESGTGKELVARALHRNSPRANKPFVAINCAALTESLLEDELFGHERGAFTGAIGMKKGKFEIASGGTIFLDEVGELAPALQAKLLRVLQTREFERVGGTTPIRVDVRILAASNRDLEAEARSGKFRQDLFFRLNVISIRMPPLRERRDDIPLLAAYFADRFSKKMKRKLYGISDRARACMAAYDWPGNVRELENALERAVVLGNADLILPEDLPEAVAEAVVPVTAAPANGAALPSTYHAAVTEAKRRVIKDALSRANGVFTEAAKLLDIHPNYLHRLVNSLQLR
jgi:transcriptional regulator with GAF, ATPase, and Fis domain